MFKCLKLNYEYIIGDERVVGMDKERVFSTLEILKKAINTVDEKSNKISTDQIHDVLCALQKVMAVLSMEENDSSLFRNAILSCLNMEHSLQQSIVLPEKRQRIFSLEVRESYQRVHIYLDFEYRIKSNSKTMRAYRESVVRKMQELYQNRMKRNQYKYKASILVTGYNQLEYTKRAIDSIFKYTDFVNQDLELITVNNGSNDGTEAYFESLPHVKKLNFKYNSLPVYFNDLMIEGKYVVGFSNDVVATPHWLEQLLTCMESSDDIAMAVPTCNADSIAAFQGIPVPYHNDFNDMEQMQAFALQYNHSNPKLWEERMILMPFLGITRYDLWACHFMDFLYTKLFFIDDDYSTLFRRTGWRMVLAKDTFMHHFGSVTLSKGVKNQNDVNKSLQEMRQIYFSKWGVDAWESKCIMPHFDVLNDWLKLQEERGDKDILWIEPKFCGGFLQMKNVLCKTGKIHSDAVIMDERYQLDAKPYFDRCFQGKELSEILPSLNQQYDLIGMGGFLHEILKGSAISFLEQLYELLKSNGKMLIPVKNWNNVSSLIEIIQTGCVKQKYGYPAHSVQMLSLQELYEQLQHHDKLRHVRRLEIGTKNNEIFSNELQSLLLRLFPQTFNRDILRNQMQLDMMWLVFSRCD